MKLPVIIVGYCICAATAFAQTPSSGETDADIAAQAMRVLNQWHSESSEPGKRYLHIVCWTPADRELPAQHHQRLTRMMKHIQEFYLVEMERLGLGSRTFNLQLDDTGTIVLHTVRGAHNHMHYGLQSGREIREECLPVLQREGVDADRETIVIFCNLATWDDEKLHFSHRSPYYAAGSFRRGTAWQLDSPELDPRNLPLRKPIIRDGQYGQISLGKHNSIFIGGVAHELGHALGLPHCRARPDEAVRGTALMGAGNRTYGQELRAEGHGTFLTLAHGLRLASHPQFSESVRGMNQQARADITDLSITTDDRSIHVTGHVTGSPPVYAVVAYFDPAGGSDYDATTACAVPLADGQFSLSSRALSAGKPGELRLFPLHVNGSAAGQMSRTRFRYSYEIKEDGTPSLDFFHRRQQLMPIVAFIKSGRLQRARKLAQAIESVETREVARNLVEPHKPTQAPAAYRGQERSLPLTWFRAESASVGWGRPVFDRVPDDSMLLEANQNIYATGIYAHAPARHIYHVGQHWQSLQGLVGLATGHRGSVRFEIKGDGKSLWKSKTVNADSSADFDVNISGIDRVELVTHPTEDGPGADWGMWLAPTLLR